MEGDEVKRCHFCKKVLPDNEDEYVYCIHPTDPELYDVLAHRACVPAGLRIISDDTDEIDTATDDYYLNNYEADDVSFGTHRGKRWGL